MVMDTLGLAISVGLNRAFRHSARASTLLPLAVRHLRLQDLSFIAAAVALRGSSDICLQAALGVHQHHGCSCTDGILPS